MKTIPILTLLAGVAIHCTPAAADTTECTAINSIPQVITVQGVYCLKRHLTTSMSSGVAIDIQANNVTIDLNGWKLGDGMAGVGTLATGIRATDRRNITIRNGSIRQFHTGIALEGVNSAGHLLEGLRIDGSTGRGIYVSGSNHIIRDNHIVDTLGTGMVLQQGTGLVVTGNVVSGVTSSAQAFGVSMAAVMGFNFSGNNILGVDAPNAYGVAMTFSRGLVGNNVLVNMVQGDVAIWASDPVPMGCFDNVVHGYATSMVNCIVNAGNQTF